MKLCAINFRISSKQLIFFFFLFPLANKALEMESCFPATMKQYEYFALKKISVHLGVTRHFAKVDDYGLVCTHRQIYISIYLNV